MTRQPDNSWTRARARLGREPTVDEVREQCLREWFEWERKSRPPTDWERKREEWWIAKLLGGNNGNP